MTRPVQNRWAALGLSVGVILALGYVDYVTDFEFDLFLFYALPVAIAAWYLGRVPAVLTAILAVAIWFWANLLWSHPYSSWFYRYWHTVLQCGWLLIIALTLSHIREALEKERRLNAELGQALSQVKQLSDLLPICSWCKNIRNDEGYWEEVEAYLSKTTGAEVTHGICPACRKAHFTDRKEDQR